MALDSPQGTYPDRLIMEGDFNEVIAELLASDALLVARAIMPKLTGAGGRNLRTVWGPGFFGLRWTDSYIWFQEQGIRPFTMRSLAGKTIPMWIDDPTGTEARKYPKAKTRTTESGKRQILIFRRAARFGERKDVMRGGRLVNVPKSYPGAPGRIGNRDAAAPWTAAGRVGGQIRPGNVGVRWRHPGLVPRHFLQHAIETAAYEAGVSLAPVQAVTPAYQTAMAA